MTAVEAHLSSTKHVLARYLHPVLFFLIFALSLSDQTFSFRIKGLNVRFAQILLALVVVMTLSDRRVRHELIQALRRHWALVTPFCLFFLSYVISGALSGSPLTFVKLAWGSFNISGAVLLWLVAFGDLRHKETLAAHGTTLLGLIIVLDALFIYVFNWDGPILGYSQPAYYLDIPRPHALYYEPAYAAAALCFGLFFSLIVLDRIHGVQAALVTAATLLTASRLGLMSLVTILCGLLLISFREWRRPDGWALLRHVCVVLVVAAVMLAVIFLPPKGKRYFDVITGPLSLKAAVIRVATQAGRVVANTPKPQPTDNLEKPVGFRQRDTSETERLLGWNAAIGQWRRRPAFGVGVLPPGEPQPGMIRAENANTWLEILSEVGVFGLIAFAGAVISLFAAAFRSCVRTAPRIAWTGLTVFVAHLVWGLNFCQTWPRLDFWLIYFGIVYVLFRTEAQRAGPRVSSR